MYQIVGITHSDNCLAKRIDRKFWRIFRRTYSAYFLGKYTLYFPFLKSFDLLFFTVFCAKQIPGFSLFPKNNGKYLGEPTTYIRP